MNPPVKSIFGSDVESSETIQAAIAALNDDMRNALVVIEAIGNRWLDRLDAMIPNIKINSKEKA